MTQFTLADGISLMSGNMFRFENPELCEEITIEDLARPLSNICRFAGQLPYFYSVAQHSVNCSYIVPPEQAYDALMHDTTEAFTNDIVTPLKARVPLFKELEVIIETDMARRFGFQYPLSPEVKLADLQMLGLEMAYIRGQDCSKHAVLNGIDFDQWAGFVDISGWSPEKAYAEFMRRHRELRP